MKKISRLLGIVSFILCCLMAVQTLPGQSGSAPGDSARISGSLPQDQHEGMTIAVDCYTDASRAKEKFGKADPVPVGVLPVDVFLKNSTTEPVRIDTETIQLTVHFENGQNQDIDWLPVNEVARMIAHPKGPSNPHAPRFPISVQTGADTKTDKLIEVLRPLALNVSIIPPMATIHGFLFFDMNHNLSLVQRASLYLPNLTNVPAKKPLMFFEVNLGKS